ncbi:unnamed protein product [Spirodela intermedia]|uniref:Uncharacterized protein n=1 Tax=Spirodela intermedia TaxID=51605 RepID=A0A7I8JMW3_SPIIN|nr:unnamed protein product [Spirodela intermedia]CAA6671469.1 unnamed protein product [Spirodela intermedia]
MQLQENQRNAFGATPEAEPVKTRSVEHIEFHTGAEGNKSTKQTIFKEKIEANEIELVSDPVREIHNVGEEKRRQEDSCTGIEENSGTPLNGSEIPPEDADNEKNNKRRGSFRNINIRHSISKTKIEEVEMEAELEEEAFKRKPTDVDNRTAKSEETEERENKQIGISHLPVSQLLTDRILREEGDKQCIVIKEDDAKDCFGGADNTRQQENSDLSSDKQEKTEECTSQNPIEVSNDVTLILEDQSSDKQNSPNNSDEEKLNRTDIVLPVPEMLINNAKKEDEKKSAAVEKSKTKCEKKNGEIVSPDPMTNEKNDEAEATEKRESFNANQDLHESPETLLLAETPNNKILQEEGRQEFEETKESHPNIEMLEKAMTVDISSEMIVIETKKSQGSGESLLSIQHPTQRSIRPVIEVNQIPEEASESTQEGKVRIQADDKKGRITDEHITREIPVEEKSDEEEERNEEDHNADKSVAEVSATIEMTEGEPKPAHKKSHNILSGVKSKVKHSIAKVKKAITGKPSQSKTMAANAFHIPSTVPACSFRY